MSKLVVTNIQKYSVHDGPGIRTVIFIKGCPLKCQWCANPESHELQPELMIRPEKCIGCRKCESACESGCFIVDDNGAVEFDRSKCINCGKCTRFCYTESRCMSGKVMTLEEIKNNADRDLSYYKNSGGGITFSGGEPMLFPDEVLELCKYYKSKSVGTAIETCGYAPWENFEKVLPYVDLVMFDLKIMDDEKHIKYTGVSNKKILENLRKIAQKANTVIRIPIVPGINDSVDEIGKLGKCVNEINNHINESSRRIDTIHILPYHNFGQNKYDALGRKYLLNDIASPSDKHMEEIKTHLESFGFKVFIGG